MGVWSKAVQLIGGSIFGDDSVNLQGIFRDKHKTTPCGISEAQIQKSGWVGYILQNLPRQRDDASCGVFMVTFAEMVLRGWLPPYGHCQEDIPRIRQLIAARLLGLVGLDLPPMGGHLYGGNGL
jgi:hypothetical protein